VLNDLADSVDGPISVGDFRKQRVAGIGTLAAQSVSHGWLASRASKRHRASFQTTQVYINMARQMDEDVAKLHVPDVLKSRVKG
jgi:hypothetical protein